MHAMKAVRGDVHGVMDIPTTHDYVSILVVSVSLVAGAFAITKLAVIVCRKLRDLRKKKRRIRRVISHESAPHASNPRATAVTTRPAEKQAKNAGRTSSVEKAEDKRRASVERLVDAWEDSVAVVPHGKIVAGSRQSLSNVVEKSDVAQVSPPAETGTKTEAVVAAEDDENEEEEEVIETVVDDDSVGENSVQEIEVDVKVAPPEIDITPTVDIDLSEAATTPDALQPSPENVDATATQPEREERLTDGYSEYGYTTDYLYNEYGTPPVSGSQGVDEVGTGAGVAGKHGDSNNNDHAGQSTLYTGSDSTRARPGRRRLTEMFRRRSSVHTNNNTNTTSGFSRFLGKSMTSSNTNEVTLISTKGTYETFYVLLDLLTGDDLKCVVTDRTKKWGNAFKLRAMFTATREQTGVVVACFVVEDRNEISRGNGGEEIESLETVISIYPSKRDRNKYAPTEFNNFKDFVNMVKIGLAELNILRPNPR